MDLLLNTFSGRDVKRRNFIRYLCFLSFLCIYLLSVKFSFAQNSSNKGKDFWLGYGNHQRGYNTKTQEMVLYITSDINTTGKVEIAGTAPITFSVTANSIQTVSIPQSAYLNDEGVYNTGIHVTAEKPVVIYAHIYDHNVSGATLVLPTNVLGKEYYSINYKQVANQDTSFSYFFVVAVEDGTQVEITPSANTVTGHRAGVPFYINLAKGQVYQVLGESLGGERINLGGNRYTYNYKGADLTGSRIRSISTTTAPCKKIAVFSGSGKIGIGCESGGIGSSDNLFQQVYPTTAWGKKTITVPLASRNYDIIRIVKSSPAAIVKLNGSIINNALFTNDLYYEFSSRDVNVIESDLPIQVVQYAVTQGKGINCSDYEENTGDPEMIFLNSVEQNIDHITVYSASAYLIEKQFINVVIETAAIKGFLLDATEQSAHFKPVPADPQYSHAQLAVTAGVHTLSAGKGFNAVAYGFGEAESYGYSAGTNVKGQELQAINKSLGKVVSSGCTNEPLQFSINLLYEVNKLTWDFGNGEAPVERNYTQPATSYTENEKTYYVYNLDKDITYATAQDYDIEITAEKTTSDGCGNSEIIQIDFSVFDPPESKFSVAPACEKTETQFKDESDGKGRDIKSWYWDFGDNSSSSEQNPVHSYAASGTYHVTLTITGDSGCSPVVSDPFEIRVYKKPAAKFSVATACEGQNVVFSDLSASEDGNIVKWIWAFGDGKTDTLDSKTPFTHVYSATGSYSVMLKVITDKGCEQEISSDLVVHPVATADFIAPQICIEDATAEFMDQSSISDHTEGQFSYEWDFGDPAAGALNKSTEKNPKHRYNAAAEYTATLIVTSGNGCKDTVSKTFTVNGSNPKADFKVLNSGELCSRIPVSFINTSSVDFGKITRLEWYFDDLGDPSGMLVDEDPEPGKEQKHLYPEFNTPATKEYKVRLKAFSGGVCVDEISQTITLKAMPKVKFGDLTAVCQEQNPIKLVADEETGFEGSGEFTGDGVSASGIFDPAKAGPGVHFITYTFTAENGCPDSKTQSITVNAAPYVFAGDDLAMREGTRVQLSPKSDPDIISYSWYPTEGLSRPDIPDPVASPFDNTTYTLTVVNSKGCTARSQVKVRVDKYPVIPNTFTPNGDGINDKWVVRYLDRYPDASVEIFNRYGSRVYISKGYSEPWDGTSHGSPLPEGVYYYIINPSNGMGTYKGYITIVR